MYSKKKYANPVGIEPSVSYFLLQLEECLLHWIAKVKSIAVSISDITNNNVQITQLIRNETNISVCVLI